MSQYQQWIDDKIAAGLEINGKCREVTELMHQVFPELERVRGQVAVLFCGMRDHWWLVDQNGNVIDPTVKQFSDPKYIYGGTGGVLEYLPRDESEPEPVGKCMNCGAYCYTDPNACSDECDLVLRCTYS